MAIGDVSSFVAPTASLYLQKRQGDKADKLAKQQLEINKLAIAYAKRGLYPPARPVNHIVRTLRR